VFVIVDNYSRKAVYSEVFRKSPTAIAVTNALDKAILATGRIPKYIVSDRGPQFRNDYMAWCDIRRIKPRFGAIGQHGSIAIVERFIRTLKTECTRRIIIPFNLKQFYAEITLYLRWYNEHRPHSSLGGRTPNEVSENRIPVKGSPRFETRPRASPTNSETPIPLSIRSSKLHLDITYLEGRKHLPIVTLRNAA
jgi:putative transposase